MLLTLVLTPAASALVGTDAVGGATWGFAAGSLLLALALARRMPGSLLLLRAVHPAAAAISAALSGLPDAIVPIAAAVIVALLGWRRDLAVALAPLVPHPGGILRLPPELAPREVLDAAGADESGRVRDSG
jgi:hypothetical protein